jgi:hypothetical protein
MFLTIRNLFILFFGAVAFGGIALAAYGYVLAAVITVAVAFVALCLFAVFKCETPKSSTESYKVSVKSSPTEVSAGSP